MNSVKEIVEKAIREEYERHFNHIAEELIGEFSNAFEERLQALHKTAKNQAQILTLELLQKIDRNGLSVEFKI